jgi:hypothetical protein
MTTPDIINGSFEVAGSIMTWMNVRQVWRDRGHAGIYPPAIAVFFAWGFWNLFYYPHLGQWFSFLGGLSLVLANLMWLIGIVRFGKTPTKNFSLGQDWVSRVTKASGEEVSVIGSDVSQAPDIAQFHAVL